METVVPARVVIPAVSGDLAGQGAVDLAAARVVEAKASSTAALSFLKEWEDAPELERGKGEYCLGKRISPNRVRRIEQKAEIVIAENFSVVELARLCATRKIGLEGYFDGLLAIRDDPKQPYQARMKAGEQILRATYRIREMEGRLQKPVVEEADETEGGNKPAVEEAPRVDVSEALSNIQTMLGGDQEGADGSSLAQ